MGVYNQVIGETLVLTAICLAVAVIQRGKVSWRWMIGAIALYAVHKVVLFLGVAGVYPDLVAGRYNWEGKLAGTAFVLIAGLVIFRGDVRAWGLTWSQSGPAPRAGILAAVIIAVANAIFVHLYFPGVKSEPAVDWAYQLILPSLDEEFLYRGVMLLMLERAFKPTVRILGAPLGWAALVVTLQFYVTHALAVGADGSIAFAWGEVLPLIYGALWIYVRKATGSLLLPILLHSWANIAGYLL